MAIDWGELLLAQQRLDLYIFRNKGLNYPTTRERRILALMVELGELANETKCFKFWVSNPETDRDRILEEYVDVLHFALSMACEEREPLEGIEVREELGRAKPDLLSTSFLRLNLSLAKAFEDQTKGGLRDWIQTLVDLSVYLGLTWNEVVDGYWKKWKINFERQNRGY